MKFTKFIPILLSILLIAFPFILGAVNPSRNGVVLIDIVAFISFTAGLITFFVLSAIYVLNFFFHGKVKFGAIVATFLSVAVIELLLQFISPRLVSLITRPMNILSVNGSDDPIFFSIVFVVHGLLAATLYYLAGRYLIFRHAENPVKPALILGLLRLIVVSIATVLMQTCLINCR